MSEDMGAPYEVADAVAILMNRGLYHEAEDLANTGIWYHGLSTMDAITAQKITAPFAFSQVDDQYEQFCEWWDARFLFDRPGFSESMYSVHLLWLASLLIEAHIPNRAFDLLRKNWVTVMRYEPGRGAEFLRDHNLAPGFMLLIKVLQSHPATLAYEAQTAKL